MGPDIDLVHGRFIEWTGYLCALPHILCYFARDSYSTCRSLEYLIHEATIY